MMARGEDVVRERRQGRALVVEDVMTSQPLTIGRAQPLLSAITMMENHRCHHLPVLEHGELVGVLSERELYFLEAVAGIDLQTRVVDDVMSTDTYAVAPNTPLDVVASTMLKLRCGCAVVMERQRVIGIFTPSDALRVLAASPL